MVSGKLDARVKAMEALGAGEVDPAAMAEDAAVFTNRMLALTSGLLEGDARMSVSERLARLSGAQRLAWALRFGDPDDWAQAITEVKSYAEHASTTALRIEPAVKSCDR